MNRFTNTAAILAALLICSSVNAADPLPDFQKHIKPILSSHCSKCHGEKKQKGKVRLDTLSTDFANDRKAAETWHEAANAIRRGEMPPEDSKPLSDQERQTLLRWIDGSLDKALKSGADFNGGAMMRQLNRAEYQHTMRDLLGVEMDYAGNLPVDSASPDGFLNDGATVAMTSQHIEQYLKSARKALDLVLVEGPQPQRRVHTFPHFSVGFQKANKYGIAFFANDLGRKCSWAGQLSFHHPNNKKTPKIFNRGAFTIRVTARRSRPQGSGQSDPILRARYGYKSGDKYVSQIVGEAVDIASEELKIYEFKGEASTFPVAPSDRPSWAYVVLDNLLDDGTNTKPGKGRRLDKNTKFVLSAGKKRPAPRRNYGKLPLPPDESDFPKILIESVEFIYHDHATWPPAAHQRIIPTGKNLSSDTDLKEIYRAFLSRAWRRPAAPHEVDAWVAHYKQIRAHCQTDIEAMRETLSAVLASPHFLCLLEPHASTKTKRRLNAYELASRLSYFLWSSMPDEQLMAAAQSGKLLEAAELKKQFTRMLADKRSERFVHEFSTQWLNLNAVDAVAIDPNYYKNFDDRLKPYMAQETRAFFGEIFRKDLSALNFIHSDFTMANALLAKHYGLTGPQSQRFERVELKGKRPGGLLGHGAFLMAGSDGVDTHPIRRAVWIRERLLHDPPKDPPPDTPDLGDIDKNFKKLSIREQLEIHRKKPACADCHKGLDPWGIALESLDPIGLRRTVSSRDKKKVSTHTTLPGGHAIDGVDDLKQHLLKQRHDQFSRAMVTKMLTYALGRRTTLGDKALIDQLNTQFAASNHTLSRLMESIVCSQAFLAK